MDTNTMLRIYQTYSLEKISALSKQNLIAQYAQNEQLVKLNKELSANHSTTNKILQNQIKELERQEKCRFYKNLIFNLKLATDKIENQPLCNFKIFLSSFFLKPIEAYAKESITNLEEIKDKEYAQDVLKRINSISFSNQKYIEDYSKSAWALYLPTKEANESGNFVSGTNKKKKEIEIIEEKKQKLLKEINRIEKDKSEKIKRNREIKEIKRLLKSEATFFGWGTIFLFFAIGRQIYRYIKGSADTKSFVILLGIAVILIVIGYIIEAYKRSKRSSSSFEEYKTEENGKNTDELKEKEKEEKQKFDKQKEPYLDKIDELNHKIKELAKEIEELEIEEKEKKEAFASISKQIIEECPDWEEQIKEITKLLPHEEQLSLKKFDPLFEQAAHVIVSSQDGSTSMIQRKFAIGYNRAGRLMDQLEKVGIVGAAHGSKSREVLIADKQALEKIISTLKG